MTYHFTYHSTYYGADIYRNDEPGYKLRWTSGWLAADTLDGIRQLIREDKERADETMAKFLEMTA